MKIRNGLPSLECYECPECILTVKDEQTLCSSEGIAERVVTTGCKNETKCKRLKQKGNENENR